MQKLVRESEYFVAWLLFWLSGTVGGFILGAVAGAIAGAILGAAGVDLDSIKRICWGVGFAISIPLSYVLFRVFVGVMIIGKAQTRITSLMGASPSQQVEPRG